MERLKANYIVTDIPLVSVVIPTRNSEATIENCLKSIKNQNYPNIEVIVVDNHSNDATREVAKRYSKVFQMGPERSSQRNFGAKKACGEYLFFVDSDMELSSDVIDKCVEKAVNEKAPAIIIPEISIGENFWAKYKALEKSCFFGVEELELPRFFSKNIFYEIGGYDDKLCGGGEDWDLNLRFRKARYRMLRINSTIKHHEGELRLSDLVKKKHYYGKVLTKYFEKYPGTNWKKFGQFVNVYHKNLSWLTKDPITFLGFILMKTCEFCAEYAGFIQGKLQSLRRVFR